MCWLVLKTLIICLTISICLTIKEIHSAEHAKVIIIGAGAAGIAAASKLTEHNIQDILILEAENRIGGRVKSVQFGNVFEYDGFVELGADTCTHMTDNIVYHLAKDYDLLEPYEPETNVYLSNREEMDPDFKDELLVIGASAYLELRDAEEGSYKEKTFLRMYNNYTSNKYKNDSEKLSKAKLHAKLFNKFLMVDEGGQSWPRSSAVKDQKEEDEEFPYIWKDKGYQMIFDILMNKHLDDGRTEENAIGDMVLYNKDAIKIIWRNKNDAPVKVICKDGSEYTSDYLIFTPSLGVLKKKHRELFEPYLPTPKLEVIDLLGMGSSERCAFKFLNQWWNDDDQSFFMLWTNEDEAVITNQSITGSKDKLWIMNLLAFQTQPYTENVLLSILVGSESELSILETLSEKSLVDGAHFVLEKFLGHKYNVSKPTSVICSDWQTNPHFYGSQSYQTVPSRELRDSPESILSKPLLNNRKRPLLLFAGEATHPYYYGTVHGAIESGFREATRIVAFEKYF